MNREDDWAGQAEEQHSPPFAALVVVGASVIVLMLSMGAGIWAMLAALPLAGFTAAAALRAAAARGALSPVEYRRRLVHSCVPLLLALGVVIAFANATERGAGGQTKEQVGQSDTERAIAAEWYQSWQHRGTPVDVSGNPLGEGATAPIGGGFQATLLQGSSPIMFAVSPLNSGYRGAASWCVQTAQGTTVSPEDTGVLEYCGHIP